MSLTDAGYLSHEYIDILPPVPAMLVALSLDKRLSRCSTTTFPTKPKFMLERTRRLCESNTWRMVLSFTPQMVISPVVIC